MENRNLVPYKPFEERTPDSQYETILADLLKKGKKKTSMHAKLPENKGSGHQFCLELPGRMLSYDLSNGVPITPIRDLGTMYKGAIGEVVAFINGAQTIADLQKFGCPKVFWDRWVTKEKCAIFGLPEGDLGPGSYGAVLTKMSMPGGKTFNQIDALMKQMKRNPFARTNLITTWYPPFAMGDTDQGVARQVVVAPCHGNMVQFDVMDDRSMHMALYQRSADMPVGVVLNLAEWIAFGMMVAYLSNLTFTHYTHYLPDPQMYDIQWERVEELLERKPVCLPSLYLRPQREIANITDFRKEDFVLEDYHPYPKMIIPTAI